MVYRGYFHLMRSIGKCVKKFRRRTLINGGIYGQGAVRGGSERYVDECFLEEDKRQWMIRRK